MKIYPKNFRRKLSFVKSIPQLSTLDGAARRVEDAEGVDGQVVLVGAALHQPAVQHLRSMLGAIFLDDSGTLMAKILAFFHTY
jgi:hypothetical protein